MLRQRYGFFAAAAVAAVAMWASGASSVNYPLYAAHWHLDAWVTSAMFGVYPAVSIAMLLIFGNLSDHVGRRTTILLGLGLVIAGGVILGFAPEAWTVFLGRILLGAGVGLAFAPATAAIIEFGGPDGARIAGATVSVATSAGLTVSAILGGALVEWAPAPMVLNQWVFVIAAVAVFALSLRLPRHTRDEAKGRWRPRALLIPAQGRSWFAAGVFGVISSFLIGAIFVGMGATIARGLLGSSDAFIGGLVIGLSTATVAVASLTLRRLRPESMLRWGLVAAVVSMVALALCAVVPSLPLFFGSSVVSGFAFALLTSGGLAFVGKAAPLHHRGAAVSTAYVFGYIAQVVGSLGLGALAGSGGFGVAVVTGAVLVVATAAGAAVFGRASEARAYA